MVSEIKAKRPKWDHQTAPPPRNRPKGNTSGDLLGSNQPKEICCVVSLLLEIQLVVCMNQLNKILRFDSAHFLNTTLPYEICFSK